MNSGCYYECYNILPLLHHQPSFCCLTVFPMDLVLSFHFSPEKLKGPKRQTQNSGLDRGGVKTWFYSKHCSVGVGEGRKGQVWAPRPSSQSSLRPC